MNVSRNISINKEKKSSLNDQPTIYPTYIHKFIHSEKFGAE
jgi:hypothetical protein